MFSHYLQLKSLVLPTTFLIWSSVIISDEPLIDESGAVGWPLVIMCYRSIFRVSDGFWPSIMSIFLVVMRFVAEILLSIKYDRSSLSLLLHLFILEAKICSFFFFLTENFFQFLEMHWNVFFTAFVILKSSRVFFCSHLFPYDIMREKK